MAQIEQKKEGPIEHAAATLRRPLHETLQIIVSLPLSTGSILMGKKLKDQRVASPTISHPLTDKQ